jgi:hypothetical protein
VAVLGGGLVVAFAGGGFGDGDAAPPTSGTTTEARATETAPRDDAGAAADVVDETPVAT